jgi:hypothetical protein
MKDSLGFTDTTRIKLVIFMVVMLMAIMIKPAGANAVYQLDVTYTNGSITDGPLSFGLSELPTSVSATFMLGAGSIGVNSINFFKSDVVSANVTFGDATWTENLLDTFSMSLSFGTVNSLNYAFLPITTTQTTDGPIVLNFPLSITGTDIASGQSFEYGYAASTQTVSAAVVPIPAAVWLFGSGLLGLVGIARHKKAA